LLAAAALLAGGASAMAHAAEPPVVQVRYQVSEQDPERVERLVTARIERPLQEIPRVAQINSETSHGTLAVDVHFDGGATEQDVEAVARRPDQIMLPAEVEVLSRTVQLGPRMRNLLAPPPQPR